MGRSPEFFCRNQYNFCSETTLRPPFNANTTPNLGGGGLEYFLGGLDFFLGGLELTSGGVQPPLTPPGKSAYAKRACGNKVYCIQVYVMVMILVKVTASVEINRVSFHICPSEPSKEHVKISHVIVECRMIGKCNLIYNNHPCLQHPYYVLVILILILPWFQHG